MPTYLRSTLIFIALFSIASAKADNCTITPKDLKCEYCNAPIAIDTPEPRLSWILISDKRNQTQSAYQIMVADSIQALKDDQPNLWDSSKVLSNQTVNITYQGKPLTSELTCYWKLRVWDKQNNPSKWSNPAKWEMALMDHNDFKAKWINDGKKNPPTASQDSYKEDPAPLFRHQFALNKPVKRARLYITGLGYYESYLNSKKIGDHVLDPAWTVYSKQIQYNTFDVTNMLKQGQNCIAAILGNGWYNPLPLQMWGWLNLQTPLTTGRPRLLAQLIIEFNDGTKTTIITDENWKTSESPILKNNIYLGELYDATKEIPNWNSPNFDDTSWKNAALAQEPVGVLKAAALPPIRITKKIKPVKIFHTQKDVTIYDFGQNFAGWVKLKINAPAGTKIKLRYGELFYDDGKLNPMTSACGQIKGLKQDGSPIGGPGAPEIACQQDTYIAKAAPNQYYTPTFTFHAFRYVEVTGNANPLTLNDIVGLRLNTDIEKVGQFSCSNDLFNKIQKITEQTFLSNIFSLQSDCPHRERFGYGGDIAVTTDAFIMNFNMARFYANTVNLFTDSAQNDGTLTDTAPFVGIDSCGPAWAMTHPLLQSELYQYYGNKRLIQQHYQISKRWLDMVTKQYPNHIIEKGLSDHESLEKTPSQQLVTPLYYQSAKLLERLASVIGNNEQADHYNKLAENIRTAYLKKINTPEAGTFDPCTQTSQSFAIYQNLVPDQQKDLAIDALLKNIAQHDDHLTTGIFGTKFMLESLSRTGHADIAYKIVNQKTFPGWGYMIEKGATTLWEKWAYDDNIYSHNHPMFGSVSEWFYRWLGGIQPADDAVAFDKIVISPQMIPALNWVKSSHKSIQGLIVSNWVINKNCLKLQFEIPVNTSAFVYIPAMTLGDIKENSTPVKQISDIKFVNFEKNTAIFKIGSGRYNFESKLPQK